MRRFLGAGHTGWLTTSVILDNTPPEVQVTNITESSAFAYVSDTTVYYGVGSGDYTVQVHATDNLAIPGLLTSCVVIRVKQAEKRVQEMIASLPEPPNAVLLDEMAGVDYGSDEACYTAYLDRLYGANQPPAEILSFYEDALLSRGEWEKIEKLSST